MQADRGARPAQTPFLAAADLDAYLSAEPVQDERFVRCSPMPLSTPGATRRRRRGRRPDPVAGCPALRPHPAAAYPANGRALTDDVVDYFLHVLTNGKVTEDKVGPHADMLKEFPYVGPPHNATTRR